MTRDKNWVADIKLCNIVSRFISSYEVSRVNWDYVAICLLFSCVYIYELVNLFVFLGNWDILTLLVMADIVFFMVVTIAGLNVIYRVMFLLVMDLVVCIYVMYL
jgi:hypothetical protein